MDSTPQASRLEKHRILDEGDAGLLASLGRRKVFRAGQIILNMHGHGDGVFRIDSGWAVLSRIDDTGRRQIAAVLLPGDIAGAESIYVEHQYDRIECVTDVVVRSVPAAALSLLAGGNAAVSARLLFQLADDKRRLLNWVSALGCGNAKQRTALWLLDLRARLSWLGLVSDETYRFPFTQQLMGEYLSLTVVHVNRILRQLREESIVTVTQSSVRIADLHRLAALAAPLQDMFERHRPEFTGGMLPAAGVFSRWAR